MTSHNVGFFFSFSSRRRPFFILSIWTKYWDGMKSSQKSPDEGLALTAMLCAHNIGVTLFVIDIYHEDISHVSYVV